MPGRPTVLAANDHRMRAARRERRKRIHSGETAFVFCCAAAFLVIVACAAYFVAIWLF